jgi:Nucleotidyltransferase domain
MIDARRRQLIDRIVAALAASPAWDDVLGVRLGGSLGRGEGDESSDVDLFLVVADETRLVESLPDALARIGAVRSRRGPVFVPGFGHSFSADVEGAGVVQLNVTRHADLEPTYLQNQRSEILHDPHGVIADQLAASRGLEPDWAALEDNATSLIWFRSILVVKEAKRGNAWQSYKYLREVLEQVLVLRHVRRRTLPPGLNFREPGREVERTPGHEPVSRAAADGLADPVGALRRLIEDTDGPFWRRLGARLSEEW